MSKVPGLENVIRYPLERRIDTDKPPVANLQAEIVRPERWKVEPPADVEQSD